MKNMCKKIIIIFKIWKKMEFGRIDRVAGVPERRDAYR
jgi:hypothetical protein